MTVTEGETTTTPTMMRFRDRSDAPRGLTDEEAQAAYPTYPADEEGMAVVVFPWAYEGGVARGGPIPAGPDRSRATWRLPRGRMTPVGQQVARFAPHYWGQQPRDLTREQFDTAYPVFSRNGGTTHYVVVFPWQSGGGRGWTYSTDHPERQHLNGHGAWNVNERDLFFGDAPPSNPLDAAGKNLVRVRPNYYNHTSNADQWRCTTFESYPLFVAESDREEGGYRLVIMPDGWTNETHTLRLAGSGYEVPAGVSPMARCLIMATANIETLEPMPPGMVVTDTFDDGWGVVLEGQGKTVRFVATTGIHARSRALMAEYNTLPTEADWAEMTEHLLVDTARMGQEYDDTRRDVGIKEREAQAWKDRLVRQAHRFGQDQALCEVFDNYLEQAGLPRRNREPETEAVTVDMSMTGTVPITYDQAVQVLGLEDFELDEEGSHVLITLTASTTRTRDAGDCACEDVDVEDYFSLPSGWQTEDSDVTCSND